MKRFLLLLLLALFGGMVYFIYSKGIIYYQFIPLMAIVIAFYYISTSVVTKSMVKKSLGNEDFFMIKGSMPTKDEKDLIVGAFVVTKTDILFYKRKSAFGGVSVIYSASVSALEEYTIGKVDDIHSGIILHFKGDEEVKIGAANLYKHEAEFKKMIGWT